MIRRSSSATTRADGRSISWNAKQRIASARSGPGMLSVNDGFNAPSLTIMAMRAFEKPWPWFCSVRFEYGDSSVSISERKTPKL